MSNAPVASAPVDAGDSVVRWGVIIAAGMFATNLGIPDALDLPIRNILRTELKLGRDEVSLFISLSGLSWYLKILAGLVSDSFPIFGSRRKSYLVIAGLLAAAGWLVVGTVEHRYWPLFFALMVTHAMLVFISTVTAALIVEAGKRLGAEGQLVTVRVVVESACGIVAGPLAGTLAGLAFGWTGVAGAIIAASVVPAALLLMREPERARYDVSALREARLKLREALTSRPLWYTALFLVMVNVPQTFTSSVNFHQTEQLGFANSSIGYLTSLFYIASLATAAAYGVLRARVPLRTLLVLGILCGALGSGAYIFYSAWEIALAVEIARGILTTLGICAFMEVAVRATPTSIAAMGFALLMSGWNIGIAIGDYAGAWLIERGIIGFYSLAIWYAALSALCLLALPLLPRAIFVEHDAAPIIDAPAPGK